MHCIPSASCRAGELLPAAGSSRLPRSGCSCPCTTERRAPEFGGARSSWIKTHYISPPLDHFLSPVNPLYSPLKIYFSIILLSKARYFKRCFPSRLFSSNVNIFPISAIRATWQAYLICLEINQWINKVNKLLKSYRNSSKT